MAIIKIKDIINFNDPIVFLDIEATNNNYEPKFLQLSAIVIEKNKITKTFDMWSNPNSYINEKILDLINKKKDFFKNQKSNKFVLREFIKFTKGYSQFVCFGDYDQRILDYQYSTIHKQPIKLIDIQKNFFNKFILNKQISISLGSLAEAFGIPNTQREEHNALMDTTMLFNVVRSAIDVESEKNLTKIISNELIRPRKKIYKKNSEIKLDKIEFNISKNTNYVYFDLKINKKNIDLESNKKYVSSMHFIAKKYSSKGELLKEMDNHVVFSFDEQEKVEIHAEWIFKKFNDIFFLNSILIYDKYFNEFLNYYQRRYMKVPIFFYVSKDYIKYYVRNVLGINDYIFMKDDKTTKKMISLINQKWNQIILRNNSVK